MTNILVGPLKRDPDFKDIISSYEILGDYAASPEILTFNSLDLTNEEQISTLFKDITGNLPMNWKPEQVIFWGLDREIVPDGLEDEDYPVVAVVFNWNMAFESVIKNISRFDWIYTDKKGEQLLKQAGFNNVTAVQLRSFSPYLHRKIDYCRKEYDITFIGDLSPELHPERSRYLHRIARLGDKYKIKITSGVYGEDYVELINESKIVFNYCNKQEANQRCFEVTACGSLLFVEEENLEIKDFFTDKEHCVFYNDENFESLLEHYLENETEREKIAKQGLEKVQTYNYEYMFDNLIKKISELDYKEIRKNRTFKQQPLVEQQKAIAKQALQSNVPGKFYIVERELRNALEKNPADPELSNNLGVIYANAFFALTNKEDKSLLSLAKNHLNEAMVLNPVFALARFNLGCLYYMDGDYDKAEDILNSFIMTISNDPEEAIKQKGFYYVIPNLSFHNDFKLAWEEITYNFSHDLSDQSFGYCDLLLNKALEMLGDIAKKNRDFELAEEMYLNALQTRDDLGEIKFKLAEIYDLQGKNEEAAKYYQEVITEKPFHIEGWMCLLSTMQKLNNSEEYKRLSSELLTISKISPKYKEYKKVIEAK
jgi:tetratricopeptide (TPR) repeat protein